VETHLLEAVGKIAGIGGIALGVFLLLFRDVIRKNIFPKLSDELAYRLIRQFMYLTFAIAAFGIAAWVYVTVQTRPKVGEPKETLITDPQIGPQRIPSRMMDPLPNVTGDALTQELRDRGSLTLDSSILTLGQVGAHVSILIACHTLRLQNGARIVTNGNALILQTAKLVFSGNSGIVSFAGDGKKATNGGPGGPGFPGEHGGRIVLSALLGMEGAVKIFLPGQDGGNGGQGLPGDPGSVGNRGADAVKGFLDCRSGGQDGGQGGQGGPGKTGGDGGRGGDGGELLVSGNLLSNTRSAISFEAPGGLGGDGGQGGLGGAGGPGGQGGSGDGPCSGGHPGPQGLPGRPGDGGHAGQNGRAGTISKI